VDPYATEAQLAEWLPSGTAVPDAARLLKRASELVHHKTRFALFDADPDTYMPTEASIVSAFADACCAQVEFWLDVGEEHDVEGLRGGVAIGSLRLDHLPPDLAPRARRILSGAGLLATAINEAVVR
jgi:hypothetical protein